jgi:peptidoglycan/LPS O-acetylase OafA/YrhL
MTKKIEVIDFLKGYSILSIVIFHLFQNIPLPAFIAKGIDFGGTGVHTFIFASGFGLYLSHLKKPLDYVSFLKKRFSKIYTPYILVVLFIAGVSLFIPIYENSLYAVLGHVLLYKMFDNDIICSYGYQFWFISTILQFYLLFPLFVLARRKIRDAPFLISALAISLLWGALLIYTGKDFYRDWTSAFFTYLWEFCLGMFLAERYLKRGTEFWNIPIGYLLLLAIGGLALYGLLALKFGVYGRVLNDIPALFGYTSLAILLYRLGIPFINRFILITEKISYPLFLIHFFILQLVLFFTRRAGMPFNALLLVLTFLICYFVSFPLQKILTRLTNALSPKTAA